MIELTEGPDLHGFGAEETVEHGLWLRNWSNVWALPITYTNGMIGCVVTAEQVLQGGYEPDDFYPYVCRSERFTTGAEVIIRSAVAQLLTDGTPTQ